MANTINWGQAAVDNTIDYGQGATDNTISWGKSQTLSPSGETNITGAGGTPAFTNTLSTTFDGTDDFVNVGDSNDFSFTTGSSDLAFSVSFWLKINSTSGADVFVSKDSGGSNREWTIGTFSNLRRVRFFLKNQGGGNQQSIEGGTSLTPNQWYNVVCTYDGRGGSTAYQGLKIYINGALEPVASIVNQSYSYMSNTTAPLVIGSYASQAYLQGNLDEVAIWNSELSASDASAIGSTVPTDLTSYNPLGWWRMGDGSTYPTINDLGSGSNNGTMTNMSSANFVTDVPT